MGFAEPNDYLLVSTGPPKIACGKTPGDTGENVDATCWSPRTGNYSNLIGHLDAPNSGYRGRAVKLPYTGQSSI